MMSLKIPCRSFLRPSIVRSIDCSVTIYQQWVKTEETNWHR